MSVMLTGGCMKCGRFCSTGIDSHLMKNGEIIDHFNYTTSFDIVCYLCYDKHFSIESIRDKKLNDLLKKPWYRCGF